MSTQPPTTTMPTPQQTPAARTTGTTTSTRTRARPGPARFRGGRDRWRDDDEPEPASAAAQAPLTFDPFCRYRLPNRIDDGNQAMLRDRTRDTTDAD